MTSRREFVHGTALACLGTHALSRGIWTPRRSALPVPTAAQVQWQRDELAMFVHFGMNTFTNREWGDGTESPTLFAPTSLDTRQWARTARAAGFKSMILTAKHHDGFCLWPTATTRHSVASSGWRDGNGDVVREFVDACRAEGLRAGLYLSPWDRNASVYGDSPRYNDFYAAQLTELLTHYGPLSEVWFDGANGEGPTGRKQVYDWPRTWALVRQHQPGAVIFSDAGPDVRWIGNESGSAGETNWSMVDPAVVPFPGASGDAVIQMLQRGDPRGSVWRPGETDVSIRPGWFYHEAEDAKVRSGSDLVSLYFSSVGRNSKLLLNVPPGPDGQLHGADVHALQAMHNSLDHGLSQDLASGVRQQWHVSGTTATAELDLGSPIAVGVVDLSEAIADGQQVSRYHVEGDDGTGWRTLYSGTTIGYRRLTHVDGAPVQKVRVTIDEALSTPRPIAVRLHASEST
ncbi:MAG TPA: alpha-L-fucosidase [Gemmatimonadales bacterium]